MGLYVAIPTLVIAAILQASFLPKIPLLEVIPNLTLLVVIGWSMRKGSRVGIIWALVGGITADLASGAPLAISVLPFMAAALISGAVRRRLYPGNIILPALFVVLGLVSFHLLEYLLIMMISTPVQAPPGLLNIGSRFVVLHVVLSPLAYLFTGWLTGLVEGPRIRIGA
ncbi:MAG: rod shape-determining protein MreD [Chloroflexota bacterium]